MGQVEVSEYSVHYLKFVAGIDEEIGFACTSVDFATTLTRNVLQGAHCRCANGYNSARFAAGLTDPYGTFFGN